MKLTLDHTQRLNLHALLGAQRADVGSIRAIWTLQDKIALDAGEQIAIELKREFIGGQERVLWNPGLQLPPRDFDLSETELNRTKIAIQNWESYGANPDRHWLEPILNVLFPGNLRSGSGLEAPECPPQA